jgi:AhpD family alkylhydroperoxidase
VYPDGLPYRLKKGKEDNMSQSPSLMTEAVTELVAIGAAIAAPCEPCFQHHSALALKLGVTPEDLRAAVKIAQAVKAVPQQKVMEAVARLLAVHRAEAPGTVSPCCCGSGQGC